MGMEHVFGMSATNLSLHERFSYLAKRPRLPQIQKQPTINQALIQQIAQQLEFQQMQMQNCNYGFGRRRRYSEGFVAPPLYRSSSMISLNDDSWDNDSASWRGSTGNLSTTSSGTYFKIHSNRRGRRRGFYRGVGLMSVRSRLGRPNIVGRQAGTAGRQAGPAGRQAGTAGRGRGTRGRARGRGKLGVSKNVKPVPTREQLDAELDKYMASCKSRLDKELDEYRSGGDMDIEMMDV